MSLDPDALLEHDARLRRVARAIVRDAARADDVVQRAYLAALSSRHEIRSPLHWLIGAIRRLAAESFRSETRRGRRERECVNSSLVASPDELIERERVRRAVFDGLMALDEPLRTTLCLRFLDDLPPREIAKRQAIPVDAVHSRVARGLGLLRDRLSACDPSDRQRPLLALVPFAAGAPFEGLAAVLTSWVPGAIFMSTKVKIAAALGVVAVTTALVFEASTSDSSPEHSGPISPAANARIPPTEGAGASVAPDEPTIDREVVAAESSITPPDEPATSTPSSALVVKAIFDPDLVPAAGLGLVVTLQRGGNDQGKVRRVVTDERGEIRFDELPPGYVTVRSDRGGIDGIELEPGELETLEFHVPPGAVIEGRVLDGSGRGIVDAGIFLSEQISGEGSIVVRTDSSGRYSLRNVSSLHYLGARKDGYAPSRLRLLLGSPEARHEIDLVLEGEGGALEGTVLSADGAPLPGAHVVFDSELVAAGDTGYGRDDLGAVPHDTDTDAAGRFRYGGLPPGRFSVKAHADGHSIASAEIEITPGGITRTTLRLSRSGRIAGRVVDESGAPVEGAVVRNPGGDELGGFSAASDATGAFELPDVPAGRVRLLVEAESHRESRLETMVSPGEETRLEVVLRRGNAIRGRVLDDSGRPLEGVSIEASPEAVTEEGGGYQRAETDANGRFALLGLAEVPWNLEFVVRPSYLFPAHRERAVTPDSAERTFTIPSASLPSILLRGRVLDPSGDPLVGIRVTVARSGRGSAPLLTTDSDGRFEHGPVPPGEYFVLVSPEIYPDLRRGPVRLRANSDHDFGDLICAVGQRLTVRVSRPPELEEAELWPVMVGADGARHELEMKHDVLTVASLPPGEHELRISGRGVADRSIQVTVHPGEDAFLEVVLEAGHERTVELHDLAKGERDDLPLRVEDSTGSTIFETRLWRRTFGSAHRGRLALKEGDYVLIVEAPDAALIRKPITVRADDPTILTIDNR